MRKKNTESGHTSVPPAPEPKSCPWCGSVNPEMREFITAGKWRNLLRCKNSFHNVLSEPAPPAPAPQETAGQLYKRFGGLTCSNKVIDDIYAAGAASRVQGLEERLARADEQNKALREEMDLRKRAVLAFLRMVSYVHASDFREISGMFTDPAEEVKDWLRRAALTEDSHGG